MRRGVPAPLAPVVLCLALALAASAQTKSPAAQKAPAAKSAAAQATAPPMEPKALDILKATSARLAAAHTLSFNAVELFEQPSRQGDPLAYTMKYEVKLQRPDKLRVIIAGDGPASEFYYDGKTMAAFAPAENLLAVADAPPTIDATLESAYKSAEIYFPFEDIIVADPYKDMQQGLQAAYYIGQSHVVAGITTEMMAYVDGGVFIQLWVGVDDKLPRLIRAMYLDDPLRLRHELQFSDWQLDTAVTPDMFALSNTSNAKRINFAHPNPEPPPGAKAPATPRGKSN